MAVATGHAPSPGSLDGINVSKCLQDASKFEILVCGKTGVGKSSLINSLVGVVVCEVNDPGMCEDDPDEAFGAGTLDVNATSINIDGIIVSVWDSPGLQDDTGNEDQYLENMYDKCKDVDLVLYCLDMTTVRWTPPEVRATELITKKFGIEFWKKTVVVMTKANQVRVPPKERDNQRTYHQRLYHKFVEKFRNQLISQDVSHEISHGIPAVAVGFCDVAGGPDDERYIWYVSEKAKNCNEKIDFLPELWVTCFETLSGISRDKFVRATTHHRLKPLCGPDTAEHKRFVEIMKERNEKESVITSELQKQVSESKQLQKQLNDMQKQLETMQQTSVATVRPLTVALGPEHISRISDTLSREQVQEQESPVDTENVGSMIGSAVGSLMWEFITSYFSKGPMPTALGIGKSVGKGIGGLLRYFLPKQADT